MQLSVKGKQIDVGDALRTHIETSLESAVAKYFDNALEGTVVLAREGHMLRADISVHIGRSILIQGRGEAADGYAAFDAAAERIAKRLRRYKRRLRDHRKNKGEPARTEVANKYILAGEEHGEAAEASTSNPVIVAEMSTDIATMTVGEAVMRMDLADLPAMMFRNSAHGGLNMVYRRGDGNVGWIDPQAPQVAV